MMNTKKNIDRLFQEKFKDFEVSPDESVWEKIKARQDKGRKRALVLPIWYRIAGIAASIALILTIGYVSFNDYTSQETVVLTSEDSQNETENSSKDLFTPKQKNPKQDVIIVNEEQHEIPSTKSNPAKTEKIGGQNKYANPVHKKGEATMLTVNTKKNTSKNNEIVANISNSKDTTFKDNTSEQSSAVATNFVSTPKEEKNNIATNAGIASNPDTHLSNITETQKQNPEYQYPLSTSKENNSNQIASTPSIDNHTPSNEKEDTEETVPEDPNKKSIFDAIQQPEEAIAEEQTSPQKKWNISPNVAPVYYDVIGDGSSIDPQFSDNNKNGQVNLSYGVKVSYTISKKLSVRSGVNRVDLSYNTEDVGFTASARGQNLQSIDYDANAEAILVSDVNTLSTFSTDGATRASNSQPQNIGQLNQRIGYIEVPMEMKYTLVDKKIGVNMIGGVSTLFLQDNEISIEAGDFETTVGQGNNLNDVSFSGNIGLGMDYNVTDQFQINLEPIFKYQFNAFNGNAESFRPYYFGIYTGVSFKF